MLPADTLHPVDGGRIPLPGGGELSYAIHGSGEETPLLLLRPLGGSIALWGEFRALLSRVRPVISFDPRGAGHSSAPPIGTTTRRMAREAACVLDHLRVPVADVFGLSLGGMVATWLSLDAPQRVRRLVLASTVRRSLDLSSHGMSRALSMAQCLLRRDAAETEVCLVHRVLSGAYRHRFPQELRRLDALIRSEPASRRGLLQLVAAATLHDASAELGRLRLPTLLLWGTRDALVRPVSQSELRQALPHAESQLVHGAGHDLSLEQPAATAAYVDSFLLGASIGRGESKPRELLTRVQ